MRMRRLGIGVMLAFAISATACGGGGDAGDDLPATVVDITTTEQDAGPATSTTVLRKDVPCAQAVESVQGGEPLPGDVDLKDLARRNELAPLPVPGAEAAVISTVEEHPNRDAYIGNVALDDPMQRYEDLGTADFAGGVYVGLEFGQDTYGVFVMELGSPEQAAAYRTAHLLQVCDRADEMRPMEGIEGGAAFYRADTNAARAVVVLGRYEVNLDICTCVEVVDRLALAEVWAGDIVEDLSG
jgi:hypothetical protein